MNKEKEPEEDTIDTLNRLACNYLQGLHLADLKPVIFNGDVSVTIIPDDGDAFNLNPVSAGHTKFIESNAKNNQGAVARIYIGYTQACRMAMNPATFNFNFSMALNACLASLTRYMGDLSMREVTVERPGPSKIGQANVFSDVENSAAYEIRVYLKAKK